MLNSQLQFFKQIKSDKLKKKSKESINICERYISLLVSKVVKIKILMRHHVLNKKDYTSDIHRRLSNHSISGVGQMP